MLYLLTLSQAPIIILFSYIYFKDLRPEPVALLFRAFLLGIAICIPAAILEGILGSSKLMSSSSDGMALLVYAFGVVALVEEGIKFLVVRQYLLNRVEFDEPFDGIVYTVAVSLGFAAFENFLYLVNYGVGAGWIRMFSAVPMHAMTAVFMGAYIGQSKFVSDPRQSRIVAYQGLFLAIVVHGVYDYFLFTAVPILILFSFISIPVQFFLARKTMVKLRDQRASWASIPLDLLRIEKPEAVWPKVQISIRVLTIAQGLFVIVSGLMLIGSRDPGLKESEWNFVLGSAFGLLFAGLLMQPIKTALRRGRLWSWVVSLTGFVLLLPTPLFWLGLIGLYGLLSGNGGDTDKKSTGMDDLVPHPK